MAAVRKLGEHARGIEVPDRSAIHDICTYRAKDGKVDGRVDLFHMAVLHASGAHAAEDGPLAENATLHKELAGEGQNDDIEGHKEEVARAFAIEGCNIRLRARMGGDERVTGRERIR